MDMLKCDYWRLNKKRLTWENMYGAPNNFSLRKLQDVEEPDFVARFLFFIFWPRFWHKPAKSTTQFHAIAHSDLSI
ncbi:hypothetical protein GDO81_018092 [Engystomops pustulosus]|uniref:Uncharacterized protein n=1 Tax=Engystomops pustulosus TaxID=76066 RepID=A0AAV7A5C4_ENGPU|nr:hypothetical protein GDO81_018092 [Engystomops pustulosus]